jgi:glycosyltransferase involved in cell wall biosynthesis
MTEPVQIDVVICTYNRAQMLDRALETLRRQRTSPSVAWSVVVVDNNCTDETAAVVRRHAEAGLEVAIVHEPEQGLTAARRRGVESTAAPWIAFVDDDSLLDDSWIEEAARFAREHPACGAFGARVVLDWERQPPDYVRRFPWAYASQDHGPEPKRVRLLVGAGLVVGRKALEETGWNDQQFIGSRIGDRLGAGDDVEMTLRIGSRYEVWYAPRCRMRHVIAADRTRFTYVCRLVFGLGICKLFEDSMLWRGSYRRWLATSPGRAGVFARRAARDARLALLRRGRAADVAIRLSFLAGYIVGMWQFARKDLAERSAILGCAHVLETAQRPAPEVRSQPR